jgi:hypothetical protein
MTTRNLRASAFELAATGPSGLVVLDVDVGKGKPGWASLKAIEDEFDPLPPTFALFRLNDPI